MWPWDHVCTGIVHVQNIPNHTIVSRQNSCSSIQFNRHHNSLTCFTARNTKAKRTPTYSAHRTRYLVFSKLHKTWRTDVVNSLWQNLPTENRAKTRSNERSFTHVRTQAHTNMTCLLTCTCDIVSKCGELMVTTHVSIFCINIHIIKYALYVDN